MQIIITEQDIYSSANYLIVTGMNHYYDNIGNEDLEEISVVLFFQEA